MLPTRTFSLLVSALALAGVAAIASAGKRVVEPVWIIDFVNDSGKPNGQGRAQGSFADARSSADGNQMIGCYTGEYHGTCFVTDSTGKSRGCSTQDPEQLAIMRSLTTESMLYLSWRTDGICTLVHAVNFSMYKPAATSGF